MGSYADQFKLQMPEWYAYSKNMWMNSAQNQTYVPAPYQNATGWNNQTWYNPSLWNDNNLTFGQTTKTQKKELSAEEKRELYRKEKAEKRRKTKEEERLKEALKVVNDYYLNASDTVQENFGSAISASAGFVAFENGRRITHPVSSVKAARSADKLLNLKNNPEFAKLWKTNPELAQDIYANTQASLTRSRRLFGGVLNKKYKVGSVEKRQLNKYVKNLNDAIKNGNVDDIIKANEELKVARKGADGFIIRNTKKLTPEARVAKKAKEIDKAVDACKVAQKASKLGKYGKMALKEFKGFAFFDGAIELVTKVIPTYIRGGAKSGTKQLGQSAAKVGITCAAWGAGRAAGAWAGAKLGAVIGTAICPGLGSAIGSVLGIVCGCVASHYAEKLVCNIIPVDEKTKLERETALASAEGQAKAINDILESANKGDKNIPPEVVSAAKLLAKNITVNAPDDNASGQKLSYSA